MQESSLTLVGVMDLPVRRVASVSFHDTSSPMDSDAILRKGKWTTEEEDYANKIISLFNRGLLSIAAGTTLRSYLSDKLHCDPMRITKKFAGASCIGKQVFQPSDSLLTERFDEIEELEGLEVLFFHRVGDRSGTGCRILPEEKGDSSSVSRKNDSVKWNREEGDTDIASAKHRTNFGKIKMKTIRPIATVGLGVGMRSVVSAPDFSQLKYMHENVENVTDANLLREFPGPTNKIQRSQSAIDLIDFEHYISDDSAAGDLLMQFASKVIDTQSDEDNGNNSDEASGENIGPVTKFISISTIGNNNDNRNKSSKNKLEVGLGTTVFSNTKISKNNNNVRVSGYNENDKRRDDEEILSNDLYRDDDAIHIDQSSSLSCSTPLSHTGPNYEDEDEEDEEEVDDEEEEEEKEEKHRFNCYENCDDRKNIQLVKLRNIKSENTSIPILQQIKSEFIHRNKDECGNENENKNILNPLFQSDLPKMEIESEIKSESEIKLNVQCEAEFNVKLIMSLSATLEPKIVIAASKPKSSASTNTTE